MKKINPKLQFLHLAAALAFVLILLLSTTTTTTTLAAVAEVEGSCNATRIADCLSEEEEFLMESETTRRILDAAKKITLDSQIATRGFCNRDFYGNCIGKPNHQTRKCDFMNTCGRTGQ